MPITVDATGLFCPEPIMLLHKAMRQIQHGDCVHLHATDNATPRDVRAFCQHLGHDLTVIQDVLPYHFIITKKRS